MVSHGKDCKTDDLNWICQEIVMCSVRVGVSIDDVLCRLRELAAASIRDTSLGNTL